MNKKNLSFLAILILVGAIIVFAMLWMIFKQAPLEIRNEKKSINKVIMVTDAGGLGDQAFNDSGWKGVQNASKILGIKADVIQFKEGDDLVVNVSRAAENADVVIGMGFMIKDAIAKNAPLYPFTKFILIDEDAGNLPNIASYKFYAGQGGYLAGIISASVSKTGKIGIVKGMDIPPVLTWVAGFETGVKTWNENMGKDVKVISKTANSFIDTEKGKILTKELIAEGSDIVFDAAGATGKGVFKAIQEANRAEGITVEEIASGLKVPKYFAVATDIDHDEMFPWEVLVTGLKKMPEAIYNAIEDITKNNFRNGLHSVGFKEKATGISEMKYTKKYVPKEALALVKKAEELMTNQDSRLRTPLDMMDVAEYVKNFKVPEELLKNK
ncbi:MAG: BMP family ABC transporter substrate-binding protein [Patescibacteria group bacterium]